MGRGQFPAKQAVVDGEVVVEVVGQPSDFSALQAPLPKGGKAAPQM
jgi:ATP-dependent DNA ligase